MWSAAEGQSFVPTISGQVPTPQDHIQMEMGSRIYCTSTWDALAGVRWRGMNVYLAHGAQQPNAPAESIVKTNYHFHQGDNDQRAKTQFVHGSWAHAITCSKAE